MSRLLVTRGRIHDRSPGKIRQCATSPGISASESYFPPSWPPPSPRAHHAHLSRLLTSRRAWRRPWPKRFRRSRRHRLQTLTRRSLLPWPQPWQQPQPHPRALPRHQRRLPRLTTKRQFKPQSSQPRRQPQPPPPYQLRRLPLYLHQLKRPPRCPPTLLRQHRTRLPHLH